MSLPEIEIPAELIAFGMRRSVSYLYGSVWSTGLCTSTSLLAACWPLIADRWSLFSDPVGGCC
jgi:hypothetical protein